MNTPAQEHRLGLLTYLLDNYPDKEADDKSEHDSRCSKILHKKECNCMMGVLSKKAPSKDKLRTGDIVIFKEDNNFAVRERQRRGNSKRIGLFDNEKNAIEYAKRVMVPWAKIFRPSNSGILNLIGRGRQGSAR